MQEKFDITSNAFNNAILRTKLLSERRLSNASMKIACRNHFKICSTYLRYDDTNTLQTDNNTYYVNEAKFIQLLAEIMNFTFTIVYAKDDEIGQLAADGKWTGLIGMLHEGKCDIAIDNIGITKERSKVVKFSYPYYNSDVTFLTNKQEALPKRWVIFHPFSYEVWLACTIALFFMSLMFYAMYFKKLSYQYILLSIFGLLMNQSCDFQVSFRKRRLLFYSWLIGCMFITFCYKAIYLSFLSFPSMQDVRTIDELSKAVKKGTHTCMTYPGSFYIVALLQSQDNAVNVIGNDLKINAMHISMHEFFLTLSGKKGAFISNRHQLIPYEKDYFLSDDVFFNEFYSIAMAETFNCDALLNRIVKRIREAGIYDKFCYEKLMRDKFHIAKIMISSEERLQLTMEDFLGTFACLGLGYVISLAVLIIEIVWKKTFEWKDQILGTDQ